MLLRWFPWKQVVTHLARSRGFIDPVRILTRLESFGQPLEVKAPLELLRAGAIFHARGLLNTGAIQHNLDWIWPYWVERQYNPQDISFIPRAFSATHINLTHRSWTAVGIPDEQQLPIVDPRGLLTPFLDGWSLDFWIVDNDGPGLFPSRLASIEQSLDLTNELAVLTHAERDGAVLDSRVLVSSDLGYPVCHVELNARSKSQAWLVVSLRPYNPEGVSFVHKIAAEDGLRCWHLPHNQAIVFDPPAKQFRFSNYSFGDVHTRLFTTEDASEVYCKVGMASAAALFAINNGELRVQVRVPLKKSKGHARKGSRCKTNWSDVLQDAAKANLPDALYQYLYDVAVHSLILHSPGDVYPGPYTYKRFWFRDAAFILHALLCLGLTSRVERVLDTFPERQKVNGFFFSQEGEWDSNGEALWILQRFCQLTGRKPKSSWLRAIRKGGQWLQRKRLPETDGSRHAGLLPAGFSAEHLGPNDYYYWDDFWGVAGFYAAAEMLELADDQKHADRFRRDAENFELAIERSLATVAQNLGRPGMPAAPSRRLDCGAIGSLAAGYPLQLFSAKDPRLLDTVAYLMDNSLVNGGFFQDVIHSGINPYLTLHLAQVLLRAGDCRALELMQTVAELASPTGQWPEAIHPHTGGGCMGDGQHIWAAAEWIMLQRNCFVYEEGPRLILGSGIPATWLEQEQAFSFGPTLTCFGPFEISIQPHPEHVRVQWESTWRQTPEQLEIRLPGFVAEAVGPETTQIDLPRKVTP